MRQIDQRLLDKKKFYFNIGNIFFAEFILLAQYLDDMELIKRRTLVT